MFKSFRAVAFVALVAAGGPSWGFTPPASPSYCPWPAWKLPPSQPGDAVVYVDPHGVQYTKAQIDSAYDQTCWQQDPPDTGDRDDWLTKGELSDYGAPERYSYGPSQYEGFDLYRSLDKPKQAPTMIFIHGGAWRGGSAASYGYFAENFMEAGANLIVLDFINVTQTVGANGKPDGNLETMAEQVRAGVAWVYRNAATLKINKDKIYVSGHSSGGHLCGVVMTTDWPSRGLPRDFLKGAVCASGLYDLRPVALSARNLYVNFNIPNTISDLSPMQHLDRIHAPIILGHGSKETPEFQRQTEDFAAALLAAGKQVQLIAAPGYNHFEFVETFANPYGPMGRAALDLMDLRPGGALSNDSGNDRRRKRH